MSKSVKGTQTEKNLLTSFAGESQARMRYTYYAGVAQKDGYEQIAAFFLETAEQERMHAKRMFSYLEGGMVEIKAAYPAGVISNTIDNLKESAAGEYDEWHDLYPAFADMAAKEGFPEIAAMYRNIIVAEKGHQKRYLKLLANIEKNEVFKRKEEKVWQCRKCGYLSTGLEAPKICPACLHPQSYYQLLEDNY